MFARKADCHFRAGPQWCAVALLMSGAAVAFAQLSGGKGPPPSKPPEASTSEQRLYPNGLPKMETMLKAALEHHPDVLAARTLFRTAEAELRQAELKALKDIMEVRGRWQEANNAVTSVIQSGGDRAARREALSNLASVEWELAFLLGTRGELVSGAKAAVEQKMVAPQSGHDATPHPAAVETAIPNIENKFGRVIAVNIEAMPLSEVAKFLSDQSGLRFLLDKQALEEAGFPADSPIEAKLGEVELGSALQVLEDLHKPLYFVVRDYGVLVTTQSERSSKTVSVHDFWKLTEDELRDKLRQQRQEELSAGGGGGGGGFF